MYIPKLIPLSREYDMINESHLAFILYHIRSASARIKGLLKAIRYLLKDVGRKEWLSRCGLFLLFLICGLLAHPFFTTPAAPSRLHSARVPPPYLLNTRPCGVGTGKIIKRYR